MDIVANFRAIALERHRRRGHCQDQRRFPHAVWRCSRAQRLERRMRMMPCGCRWCAELGVIYLALLPADRSERIADDACWHSVPRIAPTAASAVGARPMIRGARRN